MSYPENPRDRLLADFNRQQRNLPENDPYGRGASPEDTQAALARGDAARESRNRDPHSAAVELVDREEAGADLSPADLAADMAIERGRRHRARFGR